jgi:type VI secretion system protein ImpJ
MGTRGKELADSIGGAALRSLPDGDDLLLLMCINRAEPHFDHFSSVGGIHPETLYTHCLSLAGELIALTPPNRRLPSLPPYRHDDLDSAFRPLIQILSDALSFRRQQRAISLHLSRVRAGFEWRINRRDLLDDAEFWLGVTAHGQKLAEIREMFGTYSLIAPAHKIEELAGRQSSGILIDEGEPPSYVRKLDHYLYYRLDKSSEYWPDLQEADALQIRVRDNKIRRPEFQLVAVRN